MTLNELIARAKEKGIDFDQPVYLWTERFVREVIDIETDDGDVFIAHGYPRKRESKK